jgi:hypothetical protein
MVVVLPLHVNVIGWLWSSFSNNPRLVPEFEFTTFRVCLQGGGDGGGGGGRVGGSDECVELSSLSARSTPINIPAAIRPLIGRHRPTTRSATRTRDRATLLKFREPAFVAISAISAFFRPNRITRA